MYRAADQVDPLRVNVYTAPESPIVGSRCRAPVYRTDHFRPCWRTSDRLVGSSSRSPWKNVDRAAVGSVVICLVAVTPVALLSSPRAPTARVAPSVDSAMLFR